MKYTNQTGFNYAPVVFDEQKIQTTQFPDPNNNRYGWGSSGTVRDDKIKNLVKLATEAYLTDGMVKQNIDRYAELFKGFDFQGEDRAVNYVKSRLNMMALNMHMDWKEFIAQIVHEFVKTGNSMIAKYRGYDKKSTPRVLYYNRPYSLSGFKLISAEHLDPHQNQANSFDGWRLSTWGNGIDFLKLVSGGANRVSDALIALPKPDTDEVLLPGADIVQIAYNKGPSSCWGIGMILAGLEDVSLLRSIETTTGVMIRKYSQPLYHHKITASPILGGAQNAIRDAYSMYQNMSPDSVIVTGDNHSIEAVGSESQALRVEGYLSYFAKRAAIGIGSHPALVGFESGAVGDTDIAWQDLLNKVRACQASISRQFQNQILNELLWEGGFDPYNNEADQVTLVFEDVDVKATQAAESHAADLFQKNSIDFEGLQNRLKTKTPASEDRLHVNVVDKQKSNFESENKVKEIKAKPAVKSKESVAIDANALLVEHSINIDNFVYRMHRRYGYNLQTLNEIKDNLTMLVDDKEAFVELVVQTLGE